MSFNANFNHHVPLPTTAQKIPNLRKRQSDAGFFEKILFVTAVFGIFSSPNVSAAEITSAKDLLLPLCVEEQCGVVDEKGEILTPFSTKNRFGFGNLKSNYTFAVGEKYGIKSRDGSVLVEPAYDELIYQTDGLFAAMNNGQWGIINAQGQVLIPLSYKDYWVYDKVGLIQMELDDTYYLFDTMGHPFENVESQSIIEVFDRDEQIQSNLADWVKISTGEGSGGYFFNTKTQKKTAIYEQTFSAQNGYFLVQNGDLRTLLNAQGEEILPFKYDYGLDYPQYGWIRFKENDLYGFLDLSGNVVIPAKYKAVGNVGKQGAMVTIETAPNSYKYLHGIINRKGDWVLEPQFTEGGTEAEDIAQIPLGIDGKNGVYNLNTLKWVIPMEFPYTSSDGRFLAAGDQPPGFDGGKNKKIGLYDYDGSVLIAPKYRMFNTASFFGADGYTLAWNDYDGNKALINPQGKEIIGLEWESYTFIKEGLVVGGQKVDFSSQTWEAYYDHSGRLLMKYVTDACGQQQIVTAAGQIISPLQLPKACGKK